MYKEIAKRFRAFIEQMAKDVDDSTAIEHPEAFPVWKSEVDYIAGDRVRYQDALFKVLQNHRSQSDWTPDIAVSLFVRIDEPSIEWPEWVQPLGAQDAYPLGAKVSHNNKHWISTVDNNVWEPSVYGWEENA